MTFHVTLFGAKGAEAWVRHAYNVPAHVGLGWTPYRVLVKSHGGTLAHTAFTTPAEFKAWMRRNGYKLSLQPHRRQGYKRAWVARFGTLQAS
jgi:hypothetical protein